jgi:hypothetical protein
VTRSELPFAIAGAVRLDDQLQVGPLGFLEEFSLEAAAHVFASSRSFGWKSFPGKGSAPL